MANAAERVHELAQPSGPIRKSPWNNTLMMDFDKQFMFAQSPFNGEGIAAYPTCDYTDD